MVATDEHLIVVASHPLKPLVTISPDNLSDDVVAQVRAAFTGRTLLKVRVNADHAAACDAVAADLAARVPCDLVKRVGHVLILHRPPDATEAVEVQ